MHTLKLAGPATEALAHATGKAAAGPARTPAQRSLQPIIDGSVRQRAAVQRKLVIGAKGNRTVYNRGNMPKKPTEADAAAFALKEEIKKYTGQVPDVYSYLRRLSKDVTETHAYATTDAAIRAAIKGVKTARKQAKLHEAIAPLSPLRQDQEDMLTYLRGPGRTAEHMKDGKPWNELKINGQLGERGHQLLLLANATPFEDANNFLAYNAPGLDTLSNEDGRCFGQSKMHMADGKTAEEIALEYFQHIDNSPLYAVKFLKSVVVQTPSGGKARTALKDLAASWTGNNTIGALHTYVSQEENQVPKGQAGEQFEEVINTQGEAEYPDIVKLVANAMHFPVPADVYDYISAHHAAKAKYFTKLPHDLQWYRKVKAAMPYVYQNPPKTKQERDGDFTVDE